VLISSGDKDFQQLQKYPGVAQFSAVKDEMIKCDDPRRFLVEHIIKGDTSDGIPNIRSPKDVFIT